MSAPQGKRQPRVPLAAPQIDVDAEGNRISAAALQMNQVLAQAHLMRLKDRVRHALPQLKSNVHVIKKFGIQRGQLPPEVLPHNCWWFPRNASSRRESAAAEMLEGNIHGPPGPNVTGPGFIHVKVPIAPLLSIQWDVDVPAILERFMFWNSQSCLNPGGIADLVTECMTRKRREQESLVTLAVLDLNSLLLHHVKSTMQRANAVYLKYDSNRMAILPPFIITSAHIVPILERELQLLHRRPCLKNAVQVLFHLHHHGQGGAAVYPPSDHASAAASGVASRHSPDVDEAKQDVDPDHSHVDSAQGVSISRSKSRRPARALPLRHRARPLTPPPQPQLPPTPIPPQRRRLDESMVTDNSTSSDVGAAISRPPRTHQRRLDESLITPNDSSLGSALDNMEDE